MAIKWPKSFAPTQTAQFRFKFFDPQVCYGVGFNGNQWPIVAKTRTDIILEAVELNQCSMIAVLISDDRRSRFRFWPFVFSIVTVVISNFAVYISNLRGLHVSPPTIKAWLWEHDHKNMVPRTILSSFCIVSQRNMYPGCSWDIIWHYFVNKRQFHGHWIVQLIIDQSINGLSIDG